MAKDTQKDKFANIPFNPEPKVELSDEFLDRAEHSGTGDYIDNLDREKKPKKEKKKENE